MRFFLQFLLYTFLGSITSLGLVLVRLLGCWRGWWLDPSTPVGRAVQAAARAHLLATAPAHHHRHHYQGGSVACSVPQLPDVIMLVACVVLALFFAIFTAAMFWDQYEGACFCVRALAPAAHQRALAPAAHRRPARACIHDLSGHLVMAPLSTHPPHPLCPRQQA